MSDKPAVLIVPPHLNVLTRFLEPDYTVWRFSEHPPIEATQTIRAVLTAGEHSLDVSIAEHLPNLGLIACFTAGYEGVDLPWARSRGLQVSHSPGANHRDVADHAIGLVLASVRQIVAGDRIVRAGEWRASDKLITGSLQGRRLGIVGLGAIGAEVARKAAAFDLQVAWWGPNEKPDAPWPRAVGLVELARESDILVVCARPTEANRRMIDNAVMEALGADGLLVNVARGSLVDEAALVTALQDGRLGAAALDVFEQEPTTPELWDGVPNLILTPHIAGATAAALPKMVELTRENLRRFFAGEPLANPVF
jgi:lactate dehydrogenase-like 2-hydroxyacid dehydrogenase